MLNWKTQYNKGWGENTLIREFRLDDLAPVMKLWLETNLTAHDFIPATYWQGNYAMVQETLPTSTMYVYEEGGEVLGFVGLIEDYIGGLFVEGNQQSKGTGKKLLTIAQQRQGELTLHVYKKNLRAVAFYKREGFLVSVEQIDPNTGEVEFAMRQALGDG